MHLLYLNHNIIMNRYTLAFTLAEFLQKDLWLTGMPIQSEETEMHLHHLMDSLMTSMHCMVSAYYQ